MDAAMTVVLDPSLPALGAGVGSGVVPGAAVWPGSWGFAVVPPDTALVVCPTAAEVPLADVGWGVEGGTVMVETQTLPLFL
jgi:hypothetical protein